MTAENNLTHLTEDQGQRLVRLARATIAARLGIADAEGMVVPDTDLAEPVLQEQRGYGNAESNGHGAYCRRVLRQIPHSPCNILPQRQARQHACLHQGGVFDPHSRGG